MSATPPPDDSAEAIPDAVVLPPRRRNLQWIWLVPALAALIAGLLGARALLNTGPTISIRFTSAEGLEAGKTRIRYKNVDIGSVKTVVLSPDRKAVIVTAAMNKGVDSLLLDDTRFWVVRPRFTGGELTGLSTLLSGAYIGMDAGQSDESRHAFVGLDAPPSITADEPGREFLLHSPDLGSLDLDAPVYFRRINVGKVTAVTLDADGQGVTLRIFVRSPFENYVTTNTRFWHASGLDISLDAGGVKLQTQSLVSLLLGGVAFGTPPAAAAPAPTAPAEASFPLASDETLAMKRTAAELLPLRAYFAESVRGLAPGAPVDFRGVVVGEVKAIDLQYDRSTHDFRLPVDLVLYRDLIAARLAAGHGKDTPSPESLLRRSIEHGLRAQLRSGNLLTGQRYVALDFVRPAPPAPARRTAAAQEPPEIPTVAGDLEDLQASLTEAAKAIRQVPFAEIAADLGAALKSLNSLIGQVDRLPLADLAAQMRTTLKSLDGSLRSADQLLQRADRELAPQLGGALGDARQTMQAAQQLLAGDSATQEELRHTLRELSRTAQSLRELTDLLQRRPEVLLRGKPAQPDEGKP